MISKENYLTEGLVHNIYKYQGYIYKVPKDSFEDFNNPNHFLIEQKSHEILAEKGIPAVKVEAIYRRGELVGNKNILKEKFVEGNIIDNPLLSTNQRLEILKIILKVNKIEIPRYGNINAQGYGDYSSWRKYFFFTNIRNKKVLKTLKSKKIEKIFRDLEKKDYRIPKIKQGYFLLLDYNSNNFVFNSRDEIIAMFDVDHPIAGDVLYEYAALKWYHPLSFDVLLKELVTLNDSELSILDYYYLYFGFSVLSFEILHSLDLSESINKIKNARL